MKKVLVVGGAGFIGCHIVKLLSKRNYHPLVLDNLSTGDKRNVQTGTLIEGDMADLSLLRKIFKDHEIEAVMHFAAFIDVGESVTNPAKYYQHNVVNTLKLVDTMLEHNIKSFIFSSSAAVYGIPEVIPVKEEMPCEPINPYGQTKLMVEKILKDYDAAYNLRSCCLRYFNAAGGDPDGEIKNYQTNQSNLIPKVLRSLKGLSGPISVFGTDYDTPDGTCIRDYIHVRDLASAHILAMEEIFKGAPSAIYNLGNGKGFSVKEVLQAAEKITGKKLTVEYAPRRAGDPPSLISNASKAAQHLKWKPEYPQLEKMIEHAWTALSWT